MNNLLTTLRKNQARLLTLLVLIGLFLAAIAGMPPRDSAITLLRGLSVGAVTFLVAAGFSLIFGLMDVLNLAHGTLFMLGAYVGWTVFVRPDTVVDMATPVALTAVGFVLLPLLEGLAGRVNLRGRAAAVLPWAATLAGLLILGLSLARYPVTAWDANIYERSPVTYAFQADQGQVNFPAPRPFPVSPALLFAGLIAGSLLAAAGLALFARRREGGGATNAPLRLPWSSLLSALALLLIGILAAVANEPLTNLLAGLDWSWLFLVAVALAMLTGVLLGGLMESYLIRPLYSRPMYQLMLTFGLSFIGIEVVRAIWGRTGFTMPKPTLFTGSGEGCPATSFSDWLQFKCSTFMVLGGRARTYNEFFIIVVGVVVLIAVWLLLQRTRLGMIIRAGVQDSLMVEALGINVRRVFTLVFALGVGLATLGGALAGPSMGLSNYMGESLLLNVLIALAIGGLTSYPGAAVGSVIVGLLQQFIIKYGQIGIQLPFMEAAFKPSPPLVPASTVLLMVIILLVMPHGLFGKKE